MPQKYRTNYNSVDKKINTIGNFIKNIFQIIYLKFVAFDKFDKIRFFKKVCIFFEKLIFWHDYCQWRFSCVPC